MNRKQIIDQLIKFYSRLDTRPGFSINSGCMYYIDDNTRCPIGVLLKDCKTWVDKAFTSGVGRLGTVDNVWIDCNRSNYYYRSYLPEQEVNKIAEWKELTRSLLLEIIPSDLNAIPKGLSFLREVQSAHDILASDLVHKYYTDIQREQDISLHNEAPILYPPYISEFRERYLDYLYNLLQMLDNVEQVC